MLPLILASVVLSVLVAAVLWTGWNKRRHLPPGPILTWPLVGNAFQLGPIPHLKLMEMSKKYGPIIRLQLGSDLAIALNDYDSIKRVFSLEESSGRPRNTIVDYIIGAYGLVLCDGKLWKEHRRFATTALRQLGMGKSWLQDQILDETDRLIKAFAACNGQPVDPCHVVTNAISNIICAAAFGKRYSYDDEYFQTLLRNERMYTQLFNQVSPLDLFPILRFVPPFRKVYERRLQVTQTKLDHIDKAIEDARNAGVKDHDRMDYVNLYLREQERQLNSGVPDTTFDDKQLRYSIMDLFGAGTETSSSTVLVGLLHVVENPHVMKRLQAELDTVAARNEPVLLEHRVRLPYTEATILEILRIDPTTPMGIFHRTEGPITLNNYTIPPNTFLVSNFYAVQHDPQLWENPETFDPTRFLDDDGKFVKSPNVLAFSTGKRVCVGEALAQWELFLFFANILHNFDLEIPKGEQVSSKNVTVNITVIPDPYRLIFRPRL